MNEVTAEEWQYISILIAQDIRRDRANRMAILTDKHLKIWRKIQPYCQWDGMNTSDSERES